MCHRNDAVVRNFFCCWLAMSLAIALSHVATTYASPPSADYDTQQPSVNYDEYPVIVPKRAAILLDRLMVALQRAAEADRPVRQVTEGRYTDGRSNGGGGGGGGGDSFSSNSMMERRGAKVSGTWYQCYHNAVTCF